MTGQGPRQQATKQTLQPLLKRITLWTKTLTRSALLSALRLHRHSNYLCYEPVAAYLYSLIRLLVLLCLPSFPNKCLKGSHNYVSITLI